MRIMTFNLRCDFILDINNRWYNRKEIVLNLIKEYKPDIIGVQELTNIMHKDLMEELKEYYIVGNPRSKKLFSERNDIFVSKKHKIHNYKTFWLSSTPDRVSNSKWYSLFPRICTTALVESEKGNRYRVCNSHLDFLFSKAREQEMKNILKFIEVEQGKEDIPTILMGDFNASPNSKVVNKIRNSEFNKKRFMAVQDYNKDLYKNTTLGKFKGRDKGMHIDYIFVTEDVKIINTEIVRYNEGGRYPSDHYPIIADIELGNNY